jgi:bacterioferritin
MHAQGFDVELKQYPAGWRANFYRPRSTARWSRSRTSRASRFTGVFLSGKPASATGEDIMPSEHDKIDSKKVIGSLNTILELELAGVVRYLHYSLMVFGHARIPIIGWMRNQATEGMNHAAMAGEHVTSLGGHPSLTIGKLVESHKHDITQILGEALDHERATLREYYNLLALVVDKSVWLEEYAREQITLEEQHIAEVDKMMRKPGELHPTE